MKGVSRKDHWENIYKSKNYNEVSWYQNKPTVSLDFIKNSNIPLDAKIIDVGGGDSLFVDSLLDLGYTDITVLDISENAINRAKERLGVLATKVKWVVSDILDFQSNEKYDFWHDRAAFHFLTEEDQINKYIAILDNLLKDQGALLLSTFSESGPKKCSGIEIRQYSESSIQNKLSQHFKKIKCVYSDHVTPFNTIQNFLFCNFIKGE